MEWCCSNKLSSLETLNLELECFNSSKRLDSLRDVTNECISIFLAFFKKIARRKRAKRTVSLIQCCYRNEFEYIRKYSPPLACFRIPLISRTFSCAFMNLISLFLIGFTSHYFDFNRLLNLCFAACFMVELCIADCHWSRADLLLW